MPYWIPTLLAAAYSELLEKVCGKVKVGRCPISLLEPLS
jgi:hypothetical protein